MFYDGERFYLEQFDLLVENHKLNLIYGSQNDCKVIKERVGSFLNEY